MSVRTRLLCCAGWAGFLVVVAVGPLHAQISPPPAAASAGLGEIVVTAQKRSESIEKVPVSVAAFSGNTLASLAIDRSEDLPKVTPGVRVENQIGYALLSIRGIGNFIVTPGSESDVAVYVDGVYQTNLYGGLQDFIDLDSIEVLKGPQGTLYGRNAVAGVFNIKTKDPSLDGAEGKFDATYGNYDLKRVRGYVSVPLTSTLAAAVSASYEDRNSYLTNRNPAGPQPRDWTNYTVRGKVLFQPSDAVRLLLAGDYQWKKDSGTAEANAENNALGYAFGGARPKGFYDLNNDFNPIFRLHKGGVGLTGDFRLGELGGLGDVSLTTISAYRYANAEAIVDFDTTPVNIFNFDQTFAKDKTFTQEVRIQNDGDHRLTWMVGGYYFDDTPSINLALISSIIPSANGLIQARVKRRSYAGFTQETLRITDRLKLTAGGRYTTETDRMPFQTFTLPGGTVIVSPNQGKKATWDGITYRLSLDYDFGPVLAYTSLGTGFKSGMFNQTDETNADPVSPEKIKSYEIGVKGSLFDRRLFFNLVAFTQNYSNLQVQIINISNGATQTQNAATARSTGVEGDLKARVTSKLTVFGSFTYVDPKFRKFPNYSAIVALPPSAPPGPNTPVTVDAGGNQLPYASKFSANLGMSYSTELGSAGKLGLTSNIYRSSRFFSTPDNQAISSQGGYWDLGGSVSFDPEAIKGASVQLWAKNIADKHRYGYIEVSNFAVNYIPAAPRTFGVTLSYKFGT